MNFITLKKDCIASAEFIAEQVPHFLDPKLAHTCSEALLDLSQHLVSCKDTVRISRPFFKELQEHLSVLEKIRKESHYVVYDWAFNLFEALIIVIREQIVRGKSAKSIRIAQENAVRYFITSGHWRPDDPTLVSEFYYRKLASRKNGKKWASGRGV